MTARTFEADFFTNALADEVLVAIDKSATSTSCATTRSAKPASKKAIELLVGSPYLRRF